jgi:hypothetical protein
MTQSTRRGWVAGLLLTVLVLLSACVRQVDPPPERAQCAAAVPVYDHVVINEILPHTDPPYEDAIELYNPSSQTVCVGGWFLTDDADEPAKFRIPDGTSIEAGEYLTFYEYQFNSVPGEQGSFALSEHGEEVYLFAADTERHLTGYRDGGSFGPTANSQALGRHEASDGTVFVPLTHPTLGTVYPSSLREFRKGTGSPNARPRVGPLVICGLEYHPADSGDEYIELQNVSDQRVFLHHPADHSRTWRFTSGIEYDFPPGISVGAHHSILVVGGEPDQFRVDHAVPDDVVVLGPFRGALDDGGERVTLARPGELDPETGAQFLVVDSVAYQPNPPWPDIAAGSGPAIEKIACDAFGDDGRNWRACPPGSTPGR